jgi:hypothetical protein
MQLFYLKQYTYKHEGSTFLPEVDNTANFHKVPPNINKISLTMYES